MNKKISTVCLIVALVLALACCVSCNQKDAAVEKLRGINVALMKEYAKVQLDVNTRTGEIELNAKYVMEKSDQSTVITYEIDRLNEFDPDDSDSAEFISKVSGTATFNGSVITSIDGNEENINFDLVEKTMAFRLPYFKDVKIGKNGMTAVVTNPQGFMQDDEFTCDSMTVSVVMETELSKITIVYVAGGATVTLDYTFVD